MDGGRYYNELRETRKTREIKPFAFNCRELYHPGNCLSQTLLIIAFQKKLDIKLIAIFLASFKKVININYPI